MQHHPSDMRSGLTGLLVGAVLLALLVFGIVQIVNSSYASKPEAGHVSG